MEDLNYDHFWYDIKKKTVRTIENDYHISNLSWTTICVESLLLLDGDGDGDSDRFISPMD
jgi:hypothetical protein